VYRAFQLALDRAVAIKVLKTPADLDRAARERFAERFASEARTIAHLRHPHIVGVHDFGVTRKVWIDGHNTGRHTPFVDYEVGCGPHQIEFRRPDLALAQSESIVVRPGQTFKRRYTLADTAD
jgi:serine/threonine protein kinase